MGTYVNVEPFQSPLYLDEKFFRYNNRREITYAGRLGLPLDRSMVND
jgi:hypothetical protein